MEKLNFKDVNSYAQMTYSLDLSGTNIKDVKMDTWSLGLLLVECWVFLYRNLSLLLTEILELYEL